MWAECVVGPPVIGLPVVGLPVVGHPVVAFPVVPSRVVLRFFSSTKKHLQIPIRPGKGPA